MLKHVTKSAEWEQKGMSAKGFTLIELLVVIVILGILAAVVVFAVGGIQGRGQDSACEVEERSIKTAVEAYRAQNPTGDLPAGVDNLVPGFLDEDPVNHTLAVDVGAGTYTVTGVLKCA